MQFRVIVLSSFLALGMAGPAFDPNREAPALETRQAPLMVCPTGKKATCCQFVLGAGPINPIAYGCSYGKSDPQQCGVVRWRSSDVSQPLMMLRLFLISWVTAPRVNPLSTAAEASLRAVVGAAE
ncbi:hypothetical protein BJ170DRAFT_620181 [Xylariales sp. AK1849]|nr:hypothetical protein BJ170DRAFT_620181 [Xylariales sp. AK1849]